MRTTFVETLTRLAAPDKNIFLITGDLGYSVLEEFAYKFPNQYLNVGISEQNMIGVSAGLAMSGKTVFVYSIVPFVTLRCLEQIRNDVCLQNANVKLVGVGEGFSYGQLGPTHHSIEDIAVMRCLPNMTVVCPGDPWEVEGATVALSKTKSPAYLRLGKKGEPEVNIKKNKFVVGRGIVIEDGSDLTIFSTGNMLENASLVRKKLMKRGFSVRLVSMHTVKPLDVNLILDSAKKTKAIFTLEEHNVIGGLGSAVSEIIAGTQGQSFFHAFGVGDTFTKVAGSQEYLREINGISAEQVCNKILKIMKAQ